MRLLLGSLLLTLAACGTDGSPLSSSADAGGTPASAGGASTDAGDPSAADTDDDATTQDATGEASLPAACHDVEATGTAVGQDPPTSRCWTATDSRIGCGICAVTTAPG